MMGSRRARRTLNATALATTLFTASGAWAQPTAADRETARSMMQEGRDLRDKSDLKGALSRFKAADDIMHVPTTTLEVARTQVAMGLLVEALDTIAALRKVPAAPDDPQPFKDARAKAEELDAQVEGRVPALTITVTGAADGDTPAISVDGASVPSAIANLPRKVDPGHHVVTAHSASGDAKEEVDVAEGDKKDVALALAAGTAGDEAKSDTDDGVKKVHSPDGLTYTGVVVGGVGLVLGSVTGLMSLSKASTVKSECKNMMCAAGQQSSDLSSGNTLAMVSNIGFGLAVVGAGVAVVSLIVGHQPSSSAPASTPPTDPEANPSPEPAAAPASESRLHVTPWIGAGSAGVFGIF